jgi:hypothetical protein
MGALARKSKCAAWGKRIAVTRRADAIYCSAACRQRGHRARRAAAAAKPRKAHQRLIKERHEVGVFVLPPGFDTAIVRPVPKAVAIEIIERYESMPAIAHFYFGLFFGESCEGAVVYGPEYGENLGVWDKDDFSGKIITLLRGATPTSSHILTAAVCSSAARWRCCPSTRHRKRESCHNF